MSASDADRPAEAAESAGNATRQLTPKLPPYPCECGSDPIGGLKRLFVDFAQGVALSRGRDPATRPVFLRLHGVAHGAFEVNPDLPEQLRVGLFGKAQTYPVWVRFSSDLQPGTPDVGGTMGLAIKLFNVKGDKLLGPDNQASTYDFVFQNHDVFFVPDATSMCEFTCASLHGRDREYLDAHPMTEKILADMVKSVASAIDSRYWSVLPFAFGERRFVKYLLEPESVPVGEGPPAFDDPGYLRADLIARLAKGSAHFRFMLQFQTNDAEMPLDDATVRWSEDLSPPVHVATLILPQQDLRARGQDAYGENLAFNIWRALPAHIPMGSLAVARKVVYEASAFNRRNVNGTSLGEPVQPRPPEFEPGVAYPPARDTRIVRASIHPAIGVARVGKSDEYFIGPQVLEPAVHHPGFYRDVHGALKRQAAQFRIYGYNAADEVVSEITANTAWVKWSVHLANKKAAWYRWSIAMDIPEASQVAMPPRNSSVRGAARKTLVIDAGEQTVEGKDKRIQLKGKFQATDVMIGEALSDAVGRLLVLGGLGKSGSPANTPIFIPQDADSFGNADGWFDDIADGPITAQVSIDGRAIPVEPAWVVSAPPNYAPQLRSVRTLYDLLYDMFIHARWLPPPGKPSFRRDIYPILQRLSGLQWVNAGFAAQFGHLGPYNFDDPAYAAALSRPASDEGTSEARYRILRSFRAPDGIDGNQSPWPWLYGDAMEVPAGPSARQNATISRNQMHVLEQWVIGDYEDDWVTAPPAATSLDKLPVAEHPAMLDRAALDFCLADAFHPGCEVTWPMRHLTMFTSPFRIRHRTIGSPTQLMPDTLTQQSALADDGPLYEQGPGDLTRWMAIPWQADTAYCRSGYDQDYDPFLPTFWPARVPNQVLTPKDYAALIDKDTPPDALRKIFATRTSWNAPLDLKAPVADEMQHMVELYDSMGLLELHPGPGGVSPLPKLMLIASYGPGINSAGQREVQASAEQPLAAVEPDAGLMPRPVRAVPSGASFASREDGLAAPLPVRRPKP